MADFPRIGFIGLGIMGGPMAKNVMKGGFDLSVWARRREAAGEAASLGAHVCSSPSQLASECPWVVLMLPHSQAVEEVLFQGGLAEAMKPGSVLIDMGSSDPSSSRRIARWLQERQVGFLDGPVSGGPAGAAAGTLTVFAGGDGALLEQVRPLLETMGKRIFHVGAAGAGHGAKALNNLLYGSIFAASCEVLTVGAKWGLDPKVLAAAISASSGRNQALESKFPGKIFKGDFTPGFSTALMCKDMETGLSMAQSENVPAELCARGTAVMKAAMARGLGPLDHSAAVELFEEAAGVALRPSGKPRP